MIKYNQIVFEGAGIFGIAYVGAIKVLENKNILKNIKEFAGTSSGAIMATLLSLGYTHDEIYYIITTIDWENLFDINIGCFSCFPGYGFYKGRKLTNIYKSFFKNKGFSENLTFKQLYEKTGNKLYMAAVNVNEQSEVYFSMENFPDLEIWKVLRMSTAFPFVFSSYKFNNQYYADGGLIENYPIEVFNNSQTVIGLKIISDKEKQNNVVKNVITYSEHVILCMMKDRDSCKDHPYKDKTILIELDTGGLLTSIMNIGKTKESNHYYQIGVQAAKDFLINHYTHHPCKITGNSINSLSEQDKSSKLSGNSGNSVN